MVAVQTIEARTAYLKPLAALAGRLDLLIAHLPKQQESSSAVDVSGLPSPQVLFLVLSWSQGCLVLRMARVA